MKRRLPDGLDRIIKRIRLIEKYRPGYREILDFFKVIIREQYKIMPLIKLQPVEIDDEKAKALMREGFPLIDKKDIKLDVDTAITLFKKLCKALQRKDSAIAFESKKISQSVRKKEIDLNELLTRVYEGDKGYVDFIANKNTLHSWLLTFLAESSINPIFVAYADKLKRYVEQESWWRRYCPICGSQPERGELGIDVGERFLECSLCSFKWRFRRVVCPFCGNEDHKKLRYFNTEADGKAYRVDVCDECKKYIKTIDLREIGGEVDLIVEDIGTLHLDLIAEKEGYTRGVPGFLDVEKFGRHDT